MTLAICNNWIYMVFWSEHPLNNRFQDSYFNYMQPNRLQRLIIEAVYSLWYRKFKFKYLVLLPISWEKGVQDSRVQGFPVKVNGIFDKLFVF